MSPITTSNPTTSISVADTTSEPFITTTTATTTTTTDFQTSMSTINPTTSEPSITTTDTTTAITTTTSTTTDFQTSPSLESCIIVSDDMDDAISTGWIFSNESIYESFGWSNCNSDRCILLQGHYPTMTKTFSNIKSYAFTNVQI
eukprot:225881_1